MDWYLLFPITTTILSFFFFMSVTEQYFRKRGLHQLMWSIAMFLFFITAGAEALALGIGEWIPVIYRLYYVLAAIQVPFMGAGVVYLFASRSVINEKNSAIALLLHGFPWVLFGLLFLPRSPVFWLILIPSGLMLGAAIIYLLLRGRSTRVRDLWESRVDGYVFAHIFIGFSVYVFIIMNFFAWTLPLNLELLAKGGEISGTGWELTNGDGRALVRLFSPLQTVPGGIALIGGGFYSYIAWQLSLIRNGVRDFRIGFFNVLIAGGALVLGQGAFFSGFGYSTLYISETISVALMYLGFLMSDKVVKMKFFDAVTMRYLWGGSKQLAH